MKKIIIILVSSLVLFSCGGGENHVEAKEAQKVEHKQASAESVVYSKIKDGSVVKWKGSIIGGVKSHNGVLKLKKAEIVAGENGVEKAKVLIDMKSIHALDIPTSEQDYIDLVGHLNSPDFFNTAQFPDADFEITKISKKEGNNYSVTGNLTLMGVTKSITFDAIVETTPNAVHVKSVPFTIDRTQWGVNFHSEGTPGIPTNRIISNDITLEIDITIEVA